MKLFGDFQSFLLLFVEKVETGIEKISFFVPKFFEKKIFFENFSDAIFRTTHEANNLPTVVNDVSNLNTETSQIPFLFLGKRSERNTQGVLRRERHFKVINSLSYRFKPIPCIFDGKKHSFDFFSCFSRAK